MSIDQKKCSEKDVQVADSDVGSITVLHTKLHVTDPFEDKLPFIPLISSPW